ncbi:MAG: amino acid permease [Acidobacteriaceae bacterium]|nr:amino acid permease [Acidobacteriaceae bacterium]MBV9781013.1 amino acid permease [Acidobacteriaceae bacterium]
MSQLLKTKSIDELCEETKQEDKRLRRSLGPVSLIAFGIGAVIGSGIFTVTGTAAAGQTFTIKSIYNAPVLDLLLHGHNAASTVGRPGAGPGVTLSFILVAVACGFAGLCYAELASMIPVAGSAYTYAYTTLGEIFAWIIGWDLILEYAVSNMSVAVGFSAYFNDVCDFFLRGHHLPTALSMPPIVDWQSTGSLFNIPAFIVVLVLSWILVRGIRESAETNGVLVAIKLVAILVFVFGAAYAIKPQNWHPFFPNGYSGLLTGGAIIFFTYIGFDSISCAAEETRNPQRDMPIGIFGTLLICALLYASVALVLTGIANWRTLTGDAPVADALKSLNMNKLGAIVNVGALLGMISSLLVYQYGQARVWFAMSRDRLLPDLFSKVHKRFRTPHISTWVAGFVVAIPSGLFTVAFFANLANIGTLFAFVLVSIGVIVLRHKEPHRYRAFRVPGAPFTPLISVACCLLLMLGLPLETWIRFLVWLCIGLVIYFAYSRKRSTLYDGS